VTREDFAIQMDRLKSVYGDRFYPTERIAMMFEQLRETNEEILSKTISRVICDQMNPPTLTKIKETLALVKQDYEFFDPLDEVRQQLYSGRFNNCTRCYGMGTVAVRKRSERLRYEYSRVCSCSAGIEALKLPENRRLKRWDGDHDVIPHSSPSFYDDIPQARTP